MKPTNFKTPRTNRMLRVTFRNGLVSRWEYTSGQLRWTDTGHPFDVVAVQFGDRPA